MRTIEHWSHTTEIEVAESAGGVMVTLTPSTTSYAAGYRRGRRQNHTEALWQRVVARRRNTTISLFDGSSGHYCDLQSFNSKDAVTWSFMVRRRGAAISPCGSSRRSDFQRRQLLRFGPGVGSSFRPPQEGDQ